MKTMDANKIFIDTNILVYSSLTNSPYYHIAKDKISEFADSEYELWISRQVIREYIAVITKQLALEINYSIEEILISTKRFCNQFNIADENNFTSDMLMLLVKQYNITGKNVHDCNIVATMKQYEIKNTLTHNVKDFIRYSNSDIKIIPLA